jgi:hypothetical protein
MKMKRAHSDQGIYLVLFAILMAALILLIGLVIGFGVLSSATGKMQNLANVAALGAIQKWVEVRGATPPPSLPDAANSALVRANEILRENKILGAINAVEDIALYIDDTAYGGRLRLGLYFASDPGVGTPCQGGAGAFGAIPEPLTAADDYPCFIPIDTSADFTIFGATPAINAAQVQLKNTSSNPIVAPLTSLLGGDEFQVQVSAIASLLERCTAYVLDVTQTSSSETHPLPQNVKIQDPSILPFDERKAVRSADGTYGFAPGFPIDGECDPGPPSATPPQTVLCPNGSSLFAYLESAMGGLITYSDPTAPPFGGRNFYSHYRDPGQRCNSASWMSSPSRIIWCNMLFHNNQNLFRYPGPPDGPGVQIKFHPGGPLQELRQYGQDYLRRSSPFGRVYVDMKVDPEPLSSFLLAFNAGLRLVKRTITSGDRAVVIPFRGAVMNRFPKNSGEASNDFDLLIQLTNVRNRGGVSTILNGPLPYPQEDFTQLISPNFIDMGWFPVIEPAAAVPQSSLFPRTNIVAALDEAINTLQDPANCSPVAQKSIILASDGVPNCDRANCYVSFREWPLYQSAENQLLDETNSSSIIRKLRENRISLTTILRGDAVAPNYRRTLDGLDPNEQMAAGAAPLDVVRADPDLDAATCSGGGLPADDSCAFVNLGSPGFAFRRVNWVYATLARGSGGLFCPLPSECTDVPGCCGSGVSCYEDLDFDPMTPETLKACARNPNWVDCAETKGTLGSDAATCVLNTIGGLPYILVH